MAGYPCCCDSVPTVTPCSGSTLLIDRADYEIHMQFHSGTYEAGCDTCDKLEAGTFILTWDATRSRWGYTSETFGDTCGTHRRIDIGLINVCSSGVLRLKGKTHDEDDVALDGTWILWGDNSNASVCMYAGRWTSLNTTTCIRGTELSVAFPDAEIELDTWYEFGALDVSCRDDGDCDCYPASEGMGMGPEVRVKFIGV